MQSATMKRLIAIVFAFVVLTGCQTTRQNEKVTYSNKNDEYASLCIEGELVCDKVDKNKLGPGLRFEFDKYMKKGQVNIDQSNDSQTEIPNYSQDITKAATSIIGACTGWQLGIVERSNIMDYAKQIYEKQGFDPNIVDWARAIEIARTIDKQQGLDCIN
jgi:hypothetical protein